ncbi:MAG: 16S rRNA processing protein RimM [Clostridia bacterium]|nr:16S rRNA processing protein RimM [Clostridia bacterium]
MSQTIELGKIINTHGVRGELKLEPWCEAEEVFPLLETVTVGQKVYTVEQFRMHKKFALLVLAGVDTVEQADALRGSVVTAPREQIDLPEDGYFYSDLFGFAVFDCRTSREIGVLRDVTELPQGELYVIESAQGEILVPAVKAFEEGVDWEGRRLLLRTIEGMLPDEN